MDAIKTRLAEPRALWWENGGLACPAVGLWQAKIIMLYQASGRDGVYRLSSAVSDDGERFVWLEQPVFEGFQRDASDRLGAANPRLTVIQKRLYVAYETVATYPPNEARGRYETIETPWRKRLVITETNDLRRFNLLGQPFSNADATDGLLLCEKIAGRFWLLYALDGQVFCSSSVNGRVWEGGIRIAAPQHDWETGGIRPAWAVPSEKGWFIFYNAKSKADRSSVGALLVDRQNPTVVLQRLDEPVLTASESWERGSVELGGGIEKNGSLWLYYGAGGSLGLAKLPLDTVLSKTNADTPFTHS